MIQRMSLSSARWTFLVIATVLIACGGGGSSKPGAREPQTAREKQLQEAKASGELDNSKGKSWGTWSYSGEKKDCFYVVGRRCFKAKKAACASLGCEQRGKK